MNQTICVRCGNIIGDRIHTCTPKSTTKKKCAFCEKELDGIEQLAFHLNVDCPTFDETVNNLEFGK